MTTTQLQRHKRLRNAVIGIAALTGAVVLTLMILMVLEVMRLVFAVMGIFTQF